MSIVLGVTMRRKTSNISLSLVLRPRTIHQQHQNFLLAHASLREDKVGQLLWKDELLAWAFWSLWKSRRDMHFRKVTLQQSLRFPSDGSFISSNELAGGAWLIAHSDGSPITASTFTSIVTQASHIELLAIKDALLELQR